jgi:beta-lactam-binding protein with PASTA domain
MNGKSVASGLLLLVGVGGFFAYDRYQESKAQKKRETERTADTEARAAKKIDEQKRTESVWVAVPDLTGKTEAEAVATLASAGFTDPTVKVLDEHYICEYDDESRMVKQGAICNQKPEPPTKLVSTRGDIQVVVERDTFEAGGAGTTGEWKRMPDLVGMNLEQARTVLRSKGFGDEEFNVEDGWSCAKGTVCETLPAAGQRKTKTYHGALRVNL